MDNWLCTMLNVHTLLQMYHRQQCHYLAFCLQNPNCEMPEIPATYIVEHKILTCGV